MQARSGVAVLVATAVAVAACSASEPIAVAEAPATPSGTIDLSLPVDESGFYDFDRWPRACDVLGDSDVQAVLPQATDIDRRPEDVQVRLFRTGETHTVPGARCTLNFSLPGIERQPGKRGAGYSLALEIESAGSAEVVRSNRRQAHSGDRNETIGGADCVVVPANTGVYCSSTNLGFAITDLTSNFYQDDHTIRFERGGQVTTFTGDQAAQRSDFTTRYVLSELAKTITAKL